MIAAPSSPQKTTLADLARELAAARLVGDPAVAVTGVRQDSRRVEPGDLFAVRDGLRTHGALYTTQAI